MMEAPPGNVIELPGGYIDPDGRLLTDVRIREVTGADEEALAREMRAPGYTVAKMVDMLIRRTVVAVGDITPVTPKILGELLVGDRSHILLQVRILTFGSDWEVPDFPCRICQQPFGVTVELDKDIPVKRLENPRVQDITVPLRNGREALVRLATGDVQLAMAAEMNRTMAEEQSILIDRCIRQLDGMPVVPPIARDMGMADRHKIVEAMNKAQPGPQMEEVSIPCSNCGQSASYALGLVDLFR